jgi:hypothetical protein
LRKDPHRLTNSGKGRLLDRSIVPDGFSPDGQEHGLQSGANKIKTK